MPIKDKLPLNFRLPDNAVKLRNSIDVDVLRYLIACSYRDGSTYRCDLTPQQISDRLNISLRRAYNSITQFLDCGFLKVLYEVRTRRFYEIKIDEIVKYEFNVSIFRYDDEYLLESVERNSDKLGKIMARNRQALEYYRADYIAHEQVKEQEEKQVKIQKQQSETSMTMRINTLENAFKRQEKLLIELIEVLRGSSSTEIRINEKDLNKLKIDECNPTPKQNKDNSKPVEVINELYKNQDKGTINNPSKTEISPNKHDNNKIVIRNEHFVIGEQRTIEATTKQVLTRPQRKNRLNNEQPPLENHVHPAINYVAEMNKNKPRIYQLSLIDSLIYIYYKDDDIESNKLNGDYSSFDEFCKVIKISPCSYFHEKDYDISDTKKIQEDLFKLVFDLKNTENPICNGLDRESLKILKKDRYKYNYIYQNLENYIVLYISCLPECYKRITFNLLKLIGHRENINISGYGETRSFNLILEPLIVFKENDKDLYINYLLNYLVDMINDIVIKWENEKMIVINTRKKGEENSIYKGKDIEYDIKISDKFKEIYDRQSYNNGKFTLNIEKVKDYYDRNLKNTIHQLRIYLYEIMRNTLLTYCKIKKFPIDDDIKNKIKICEQNYLPYL